MNGEAGLVHLLVVYSPKLATSLLVNNLKSISSRQISLSDPQTTHLSNHGILWSRSYFACPEDGTPVEIL
jgi:putative transposase